MQILIASRLLYSVTGFGFAALVVLISVVRLSQPEMLSLVMDPSLASATQTTLPMVDIQETDLNQLTTDISYEPQFSPSQRLPSHPLYWWDMIKDRVVLWMTWNSSDRLRLLRSYSDRRLWAGIQLIQQDQTQLGVSTVTKAEKYLLQATRQSDSNRQLTKNSSQEFAHVAKASVYHQLVLLAVIEMIDDERQQLILKDILAMIRQEFDVHLRIYLEPSTDSK